MPNRKNVLFFDDYRQAEGAGYRPCLRCKPGDDRNDSESTRLVIEACRFIESQESPPTLSEIAERVDRSPTHFQKLFTAHLGISPKEYAAMTRVNRFCRLLRSSTSVTNAIFSAGYNATSRCYEEAPRMLGMTPDRSRKGGVDELIEFGISTCSLGHVIVATTEIGICRIAIGSDPKNLTAELRATFPQAVAIDQDDDWTAILQAVVQLVDGTSSGHALPLDIRGTAFQREVWAALQRLPFGDTATYSKLAASIGRPSAIRAVASACGANELAVVIPCHRVVRVDGKQGGYRWGLKRKAELQDRERSMREDVKS